MDSTSPGPHVTDLGHSPELGVKSSHAESPPPNELKNNEIIQSSLNLSPTGTSSGVSSDSHLSGLVTGPITSAIAAATAPGLSGDNRYQVPGDYSNYYSAFYQTHPADPNALAQSNYSHFPNHHFTVSSLIQKPSVAQLGVYPKL